MFLLPFPCSKASELCEGRLCATAESVCLHTMLPIMLYDPGGPAMDESSICGYQYAGMPNYPLVAPAFACSHFTVDI